MNEPKVGWLKPQTTQKHYQNQNIKIAIFDFCLWWIYNFLSVHSFSIVIIYLKLLNPWFPHSFILAIILSLQRLPQDCAVLSRHKHRHKAGTSRDQYHFTCPTLHHLSQMSQKSLSIVWIDTLPYDKDNCNTKIVEDCNYYIYYKYYI